MNPLTEGRSLIMILNDFVLIMKDFYGRSPYKIGVNRYINQPPDQYNVLDNIAWT